jgi:heme-degrading monooxygenase HmoA
MIVVANRVPVTKGYEKEFEKRFDQRLDVVRQMPGFIRNEILRPIVGDYYILMTHWESRETFEAWTRSEDFKQVHANMAPKKMCPGPNGFEMHEVILVMEKKP